MPAMKPEEMAAEFERAFNTGDVEQVMALYEPNAVLVPEPGQVVRGTAALRAALLGFLSLKLPIIWHPKRVLDMGEVALTSNSTA
jgi:ketosteroid isomerase-like protein